MSTQIDCTVDLDEVFSKDINSQDNMDFALAYGQIGFSVIPVHYPDKNGRCTCKKADCTSIGKHPAIMDWPNNSTNNLETLAAWWMKQRDANVGIVTGEKSGVFVLDVDPRNGGDKSLKDIEEKYGPLPHTLKASTGGGGEHIYFQYPESGFKAPKEIAPGLDIKSDRGFVVAAPSLHESGKRYQWQTPPHETDIAEAPKWLLDLIKSSTSKKKSTKSKKSTNTTETFLKGKRNDFLTSIAGALWEQGMSKEAVQAAVIEENNNKCEPPLNSSEVKGIVESITSRYEQGTGIASNGNDIVEQNNKYVRIKRGEENQKIVTTLSSFIIDPIESIYVDGQEYIKANLISENGYTEKGKIIDPDAWTSKQRFLKFLPSKEFTFYGTERDIQLIRNKLSSKEIPRKTGSSKVGLIKINDQWQYLTNEGALSLSGINSDIIYMGGTGDYNTSIISQPFPSNEDIAEMLSVYSSFNDPSVVAPITGWATASFFKARLFPLNKSFPMLMTYGEAGSGKTTSIREVVLEMHGLTQSEKAISQMSSFTMMIAASSSNCFPLFLDEYKPSRLSVKQRNMVSDYVRTSYNNLTGDRGQKDLSKLEFKYEVPTVIAGEDRFTESAARERILEVQFSKGRSSEHTKSFERLCELNLTSLGRVIMDYCLKLSDAEIRQLYKDEEEMVDVVFKDRYRANITIGRFGLKILDAISLEYTGNPFTITAEDLEKSQKATLLGDSSGQKNVVDNITEYIIQIIEESRQNYSFSSNYKLMEGMHYFIKNNELRLHLNSIFPIIAKWAKDHHLYGDFLEKASYLSQVKLEKYYTGFKQAQMVSKTDNSKRVLILDIEKMQKKGIEISGLKCKDAVRDKYISSVEYN